MAAAPPSDTFSGQVQVKKASAALLASQWKRRTLFLTSTSLSWSRRGGEPTSLQLSSLHDVRLVDRFGEFAVDHDEGSVIFKANGMREATAWIVNIKDRLMRQQQQKQLELKQAKRKMRTKPAKEEDKQQQQKEPAAVAERKADDWPDEVEKEREGHWPKEEADADEDEPPLPSPTSPPRRTRTLSDGPAVHEPTRWADVEPALWWPKDDDNNGAPTTEGGAADPLGLVSDDSLEEMCRQRPELRLDEPDFDPQAYLNTVHASASFAQLQASRHNLQLRLGSHDRKLQHLVQGNQLQSLLVGADKIHGYTVAFEKILARPPKHLLASGGGGGGGSSLSSVFDFDQDATRAFRCVCDRFDPFLRQLDRTTSLQRTANLLVFFAPVIDGPQRPLESQKRWEEAVERAAQVAP